MLILFPLTQQHQQTVTYTCIALETEKKCIRSTEKHHHIIMQSVNLKLLNHFTSTIKLNSTPWTKQQTQLFQPNQFFSFIRKIITRTEPSFTFNPL